MPFCNGRTHHKVWGWVVDPFPQYHLDVIANGLVSTSLPTLGPLLGVPLSWMAINPQGRSFRNKQSHHKVWGWVVDSVPQYHLDMIANGLVSTSLPTLGPRSVSPCHGWPSILKKGHFAINKAITWCGGWVLDSLLPYQLHMTPLVAEMHKSGDSSKDHG